ncbi:hypothetical protein FAZ69_01070 [Trinickia terrae]|uniref:Uncharacterized protein n=1 Tax=Trinickia terrae TaxID=2571161 RepID=A0A4V5PJQ5_9BURK|nr:hypothetical protein [Trinickia terrae]TKC92310.1 hypothetical protein FAZ69_01070 [Trinickia terrae]
MIVHLHEREEAVEQINSICLRLFDLWCEKRCVTPLAYLMHCWPLLDTGGASIRRLVDTMDELCKFHPDEVLEHDLWLPLHELAARADDLLVRHPEPSRLAAAG